MKTGTLIRSYDFPTMTNCYQEGVVEENTDPRFAGMLQVRVTKIVFDGEEKDFPEGHTFWTAPQGEGLMDDIMKFDRVQAL